MTENRTFLRFFATLAFFTVLAGDAWRYTITWYGFGAIVVAISAVSVVLLVRNRDRWSFGALPYPLLAFLALTALSTAWSFYPLWTALASVTSILTALSALAIVVVLTRAELVRALGLTLRIIVGASLAFELVVSVIIRSPILPLWTSYPEYTDAGRDLPKLLYWSRDLLLQGGQIQGIVGNSNLLGIVALLALIVFGVQLADRTVGRRWGWFWVALALVTLALTRSATMTVALVAVIGVTAAVLLLRRMTSARARRTVYVSLGALVVVAVAATVLFHAQIFAALGKSGDLTGRGDIWASVIALAQQRSAFGWGWISYWVPWIAPFKGLAFEGGVQQLHAHNAWLDVWFQLGIVGLVVFGVLVLTTLVRGWSSAVDRPLAGVGRPLPYSAISLLPLLLLVALLVQSLTESRLLVEYGLLLLVICSVWTKLPEPALRRRTMP